VGAAPGDASTPTLPAPSPAQSSSGGISLTCYCLATAGIADKSRRWCHRRPDGDVPVVWQGPLGCCWRYRRSIPLQAHLWGLSGLMVGARRAVDVLCWEWSKSTLGLSCLILAGYQAGPHSLNLAWGYHPIWSPSPAHFLCPASYSCL